MDDLSLAEELEFESLPQRLQDLAIKYLDEHWEKVANYVAYQAGYDAGFERGKLVGYRLGTQALWLKPPEQES